MNTCEMPLMVCPIKVTQNRDGLTLKHLITDPRKFPNDPMINVTRKPYLVNKNVDGNIRGIYTII